VYKFFCCCRGASVTDFDDVTKPGTAPTCDKKDCMKKLVKSMDAAMLEEFNLESILRIGHTHRRMNKNFERLDCLEK